ncbi:MAG: VWA domain-containing protein [Desulfovibrio sp.]|nr:VWA domain-containing protein [Desulfovibrio sp.]
MRRLPVYILLDTSGSMKGEPIESVKDGLQTLLSALRTDPFALESAYLCLVTFDREPKCVVPLASVDEFKLPEFETPDGPTHMGAALELLCGLVDKDVRKNSASGKGDWKPLLFLLTDGKPSDTQAYREIIDEVKKRDFAAIVPLAAGMKAKTEPLKMLADKVYVLQNMDRNDFGKFFQWVSASIAVGNKSAGLADDLELPPPPDEIIIGVADTHLTLPPNSRV